ncbi:MAG: hypothetical protein WAV11_02135 [Minisyncoccia bacterium]
MLTDFSGKVWVSLCVPTIHGQEEFAKALIPKGNLVKQDKTILKKEISYDLSFEKFGITASLFEEDDCYKREKTVTVAKGNAPLIHDEFINHLLENRWSVDKNVLERYHLGSSDL